MDEAAYQGPAPAKWDRGKIVQVNIFHNPTDWKTIQYINPRETLMCWDRQNFLSLMKPPLTLFQLCTTLQVWWWQKVELEVDPAIEGEFKLPAPGERK